MQYALPQLQQKIQQHHHQWADCTKCFLHLRRYGVVDWRGYLPATVLFIGEAPGIQEDANGFPFWPKAPAGAILDIIIQQAQTHLRPFSYCITNLVGCIPKDENGEIRTPEYVECMCCKPRLEGLLELCKPRLVVLVGKTAKEEGQWLVDWDDHHIPSIEIIHPAFITRQQLHEQGPLVRKQASTIVNALKELGYDPHRRYP